MPKRKLSKEQQKEEDIRNYYKNFTLSDVKDAKNLKHEIVYQLYKKVVPDSGGNKTHIEPLPAGLVHQLDCLYLPDDDGYKYALTVVDVGSRMMDAEPMKEIHPISAMKALVQIYKRGILKLPEQTFQVDSGSEFKGEFKKYFEKLGINFRVAQAGRHRQQGLIESRNKSVGTPLLKRQTAEELLTGEKSTQWVTFLPIVVKHLNERFKVKNPWDDKHPNYEVTFGETTCKGNACDVLNVGTLVRYQLDEPLDVASGKKLAGRFRAGDVKWSLKPVRIEHIQLMPNQPPLYKIEGRTALYTRGQLQLVSEHDKLPPASVQERYAIDKLVKQIKKAGKLFYEVKWKGYDSKDNTIESREQLIKDVPQLVEEFEESIKKKNKKLNVVPIEDFLPGKPQTRRSARLSQRK
jgi:hypothetical protein